MAVGLQLPRLGSKRDHVIILRTVKDKRGTAAAQREAGGSLEILKAVQTLLLYPLKRGPRTLPDASPGRELARRTLDYSRR